MQQTNEMIHIKVALNNEFRRFSMNVANYTQLVDLIRTVFSLPTANLLKVCYVDDEADVVLVTSDEEFSYAAELMKPLKLVVTQTSVPVVPVVPTPIEDTPETPVFTCRRGRGRGGHCGGFKPRCEEKNWREDKHAFRQERIALKIVKITHRIAHIEALAQTELPAQRKQMLAWKLEKLQSKLVILQTISGVETPIPAPTVPETQAPETEDQGRRGCRGRGGRGGCGRGRRAFENHETSENSEKPGFEHPIWQCRQNLRAARDAGNQTEIDICSKALEEAKCRKWEARREGRLEKRSSCEKKDFHGKHKFFCEEKEHKRACMKNLREAKATGDAEKIKECVDLLIEAKEALQKAKVARRC
jgi:hypothetical protein